MKYAQTTAVSSDKSRAEIEKTLTRYGATGFLYGWSGTNAIIMFEMAGKRIKFILPLPDRKSTEFTETPSKGYQRSEEQISKAYEQAVRQRWRALALVIKAKLEAVETGITEFEDEFLSHIVLPNGKTVGEFMKPQINVAYQTGKMPALLTM